jgi:single-strand DNA-binding protein
MTDTITLTGLVATVPRHMVTSEGLSITSFRLASTQRRFDRSKSEWVDGETNWYTITAFRQLALNIVGSINKGERVIATGRLRIRDWTKDEKAGTNIEVDADAIGHDLSWGSAVFSRSISTAVAESSAETKAEPVSDDGTQPDDSATRAVDATEAWADAAPAQPEFAAESAPVPF